MQRLSGMDASFLYMETPTTHMHVCGVLVLDPSTFAGRFDYDHVKQLIEVRGAQVPQFRWKLKTVPMNLDRPVWIDDPDFDIDRHIHHSALPGPGSMQQLADLVGRIASHPLERDKPMWAMWLVEGLENGHMALVSKMHHSGMDGVTGADMMTQLFDFEPDAPQPEPPEHSWEPERSPSDASLAVNAVLGRLTNPLRAARTMVKVGASVATMARSALPIGPDQPTAALPFSAPRTRFTGTLTPKRVVAFGQADLEDIKFVKSTFGTTVNDVVLAACAMTMRRWLEAHDDLPDKPLLASVPVSVHAEGGDGVNQVSNMFVRIPTHLESPVDMLNDIRSETADAKQAHNAMGADLIQNMAQITPPGVFNLASRFYAGSGLADRMPVQNMIISNVPGPPIPLYIGGARVVGVYPFGPLVHSSGVNLTVLSNMGNMDFGVIACGDMVPDPWSIADGFGQAVDELKALADKAADATA